MNLIDLPNRTAMSSTAFPFSRRRENAIASSTGSTSWRCKFSVIIASKACSSVISLTMQGISLYLSDFLASIFHARKRLSPHTISYLGSTDTTSPVSSSICVSSSLIFPTVIGCNKPCSSIF